MNISADGLKRKIDSKEDFVLLDVRTDQEVKKSRIEGSMHIPLKDMPEGLGKLDRTKEIIVYCRSGRRSGIAAEYLRKKGYDAKNLAGGILEWNESM
jgi:rhodanese-related sulfurtransferase